ncbi:MAG TPA: isochorismatase family cysteine hydrolase [Polyangiales bacterium]|nr:isochorismatase family cysteine hydrolase [Polyangiales bacterium]
MAGKVTATSALLFVDVVNHFEFPGGEQLLVNANAIAGNLLALRGAAHRARTPVIYANDNFGDWRSDASRILDSCCRRGRRGAAFARKLAPTRRDYFVLKPANSAFYCTALEPLLRELKVRTLILCGLTADNCVLFTAHDAYLRDYRLRVPADCVASQRAAETRRALDHMQDALKADIRPSTAIGFAGHKRRAS